MKAQDIQAIQSAGAQLAQLGTAFLTTYESGVNSSYKAELLKVSRGERSNLTRLTRLFSGKQARGLVNDYLTNYAEYDDNTLPAYPQLNAMTKPMRADAGKRGDSGYLSLWAGQGVNQVRQESAVALLQRMTADSSIKGR